MTPSLILGTLLKSVSSTLVDFLNSVQDFTTLVEFLVAADLEDTLNGPGPFTVFAPPNFAFDDLQALAPDFYEALQTVEWQDHLRNLLLLHVAAGEFIDTDLQSGATLTMLNGEQIDITDNVRPVVLIQPSIGDAPATGILANRTASNG